jgi:hypothetical protein
MGGWEEGRWEENYRDEMQLIGWRWVCPGCKKEVRTIYYPVRVRTLFDYGEFEDPAKNWGLWRRIRQGGGVFCVRGMS